MQGRLNLLILLFVLFILLFLPSQVIASDLPFTGIWETQQAYPLSLASQVNVASKHSIYVFGGGNTFTTYDDIYKAEFNENNTIQGWKKMGDMPKSLIWHTGASKNNFIYILGGAEELVAGNPDTSSDVYLYTENSIGELDFRYTTPLPKELALGKVIIENDTMYYLGGIIKSPGTPMIFNKEIYRNTINQDGSLNNWELYGILPDYGSTLVAYIKNENFIIHTDKYLDPWQGYSASMDDFIHLSDWTSDTSTLPNLHRPLTGIINQSHYLIAGGLSLNNGQFYLDIYLNDKKEQNVDWRKSNILLPATNCCSDIVQLFNKIYIIAGLTNGNYTNTVYSMEVNYNPPGLLELPIYYPERGTDNENAFRNAFWNNLNSAFDHQPEKGVYVPFTGNIYSSDECIEKSDGIECYDSHTGYDFSRLSGNDIFASTDGTVVYRSEDLPGENTKCKNSAKAFGCVVIIEHNDEEFGNFYTLYAHLDSILVAEGESVGSPDIIAQMGTTGNSTGKHLHFGVYKSVPNLQTNEIVTPKIKPKKQSWETFISTLATEETSTTFDPLFKPKKSSCSYTVGDLTLFAVDPSGWDGTDADPWNNSVELGGCEIENTRLWKYPVSL